jgi:hypothetical protein
MADYFIAEGDTRLHTRYSELIRCTPKQIDKVIQERLYPSRRYESEDMAFGTTVHEIYEAEARQTGRVPACFGRDWAVSHVEHEFAIELLPGVVVHSRPDLVCAEDGIIPDLKTVLDGVHGWRKNIANYYHESKQHQLQFYAYQLGLHGHLINRGAFLCEVWSDDRSEVISHEVVEFPITMWDMLQALQWAKPRIALLASELERHGLPASS